MNALFQEILNKSYDLDDLDKSDPLLASSQEPANGENSDSLAGDAMDKSMKVHPVPLEQGSSSFGSGVFDTPTVATVDSVRTEKLSEDDSDVESALSGEAVAMAKSAARAQAIFEASKRPRYLTLPVGVPAPAPAPKAPVQGRTWRTGHIENSTWSDEQIAKSMDEHGYIKTEPSLRWGSNLVQSRKCACGSAVPAFLSVCPACGR